MKHFLKKQATLLAAALLVCVGGNSHAGPLTLAETPLFLTNAVEPNIFFLLDDSGSMDWEVLLQGGGASGLGATGTINYALYALPAPNNASDQPYLPYHPYVVSDEDTVAGLGVWRLKSAAFNQLYYDPTLTYQPWAGTDGGGSPMYSDATPSAAQADPTDAGEGTLDLTASITFRNYRFDTGSWYYETIFPATYYTWTDSNSDGVVDATDAHTRVRIEPGVTSYTSGPDRYDCAAAPTCTYAEEIQNFANWFTYYRKRSYIARAGIGAVINDSNAVRAGLHVYNNGLRQSVLSLSTAANKGTVLDSLYGTTFNGGTPARRAMATLGEYFKGGSSPILDADDGGKCQQNFNIVVTDGYWNGTLTSSQRSLYGNDDGDDNTAFDGGDYADAQDETLADIAMYYYENDLDPTMADQVPTIADVDEAPHQHLVTYSVAFGVVGTLDPFDTVTPGDPSDTDPSDPGFAWPWVVSNEDTTVDDLWHAAYNGRGAFVSAKNPDQLTTSLGQVIQGISDRTSSSSSVALSSGFLNSGSLLFQARFDSSEWTGQLLAYDIVDSGPNIGTVNQLQWDAGCKLTGGLCSATGTTETAQNYDTGREILTYKPSSGVGIPFRWPADPASPSGSELDPEQVTALKTNPSSLAVESDAIGAQRVNFLRGQQGISGMRSRSSVLGDVINSNPLYVGAPTFAYPDSLEASPYSAFVSTYQNRQPMLYVGANDGMLHGFVAATGTTGGKERIAYVPGEVYDNLSALTSTAYGSGLGHRSFVDGSPTAGDVYYSGSWKTILVGGLGRGGQGIFALNITDPTTANFDESNASSLVLWEFTDADDSDLGFTYGQPAIVRLANGKWAAVVGNGYNNTDTNGGADTTFSTTGNGVLYLIDVSDGSLIKKFDTGVGTAEDPTGSARPNGLATPSPVDFNGDRIVDYIYVGDMFGNVWKIDVSSTNPLLWDFAYKSGANPQPFFVAKDSNGDEQPITTRLEVGLHPTQGGQVVMFGTGKYIETGDNSSTDQQTQTFYSVWDRNEATNSLSVITRSHLLQQEIIEEVDFSPTVATRISTDTAITWHLTGGLPGSGGGDLGWYMDLYNTQDGNTDNKGERMVSDPVLRDGKIIFVTLLPLPDPCDFGGESWLMELDAYSGARLPTTPFDLDGDGLFTISDLVTDSSGNDVVTSGKKSTVGILPSPGILKDNTVTGTSGGREFKYFSGSSGAIERVTESRGASGVGRQSWREIFND